MGIFKMFYSFAIISHFCLVRPSPIAIRCKLGVSHSHKSKLVKHYNDSKFGLKFMKIIGCGKSRDLKATFLKQKKKYIKHLSNTSPDAGL